MKKLPYIALVIVTALLISCNAGEKKMNTKEDRFKHDIFEQGMKAPGQVFTGDVWVRMLVTDDEHVFDTQVYNVQFAAGGRTFWHSHPGGQILLATSGEGYYQEEGQPARLLKKGDVVEIPPHVNHWHGAAPTSDFVHIGLSSRTDKGPAAWGGEVTEEQYKEASKK